MPRYFFREYLIHADFSNVRECLNVYHVLEHVNDTGWVLTKKKIFLKWLS